MSASFATADIMSIRRRVGALSANSERQAEEEIMARLAETRDRRHPMFLTRDEFLETAVWRLDAQREAEKQELEENSPDTVERVTAHAFSFGAPRNPDLEDAVRVQVLRALTGVGIRVASSVLALCYPERYARFEPLTWRHLMGTKLTLLGVDEYRQYLNRLRDLTAELRELDPKAGWCVEMVERYCREPSEEAPPTDQTAGSEETSAAGVERDPATGDASVEKGEAPPSYEAAAPPDTALDDPGWFEIGAHSSRIGDSAGVFTRRDVGYDGDGYRRGYGPLVAGRSLSAQGGLLAPEPWEPWDMHLGDPEP